MSKLLSDFSSIEEYTAHALENLEEHYQTIFLGLFTMGLGYINGKNFSETLLPTCGYAHIVDAAPIQLFTTEAIKLSYEVCRRKSQDDLDMIVSIPGLDRDTYSPDYMVEYFVTMPTLRLRIFALCEKEAACKFVSEASINA